jgi:hypothetical protein
MELTIGFNSSFVICLHQEDVDISKHSPVTTADAVVPCLMPNKETVAEKQTSIQNYHLPTSLQTSLSAWKQCQINHLAEAAYATGPAVFCAPHFWGPLAYNFQFFLFPVSMWGPKWYYCMILVLILIVSLINFSSTHGYKRIYLIIGN